MEPGHPSLSDFVSASETTGAWRTGKGALQVSTADLPLGAD